MQGQLERIVLGRPEEGAKLIQGGVRLAPCDATARFVAGSLAAEEGQVDQAFEHLTLAVRLDPQFFHDAAERLIFRLQRPELALEIAGERIHQLAILLGLLEGSGEYAALAETVRETFVVLLERECQKPTVSAWALASLGGVYRRSGRFREAIECYDRALALQYGMVDWRYNLARLYRQTGALDKAIQEVRRCLQVRPEHMPSKQLLRELLAVPRVTE